MIRRKWGLRIDCDLCAATLVVRRARIVDRVQWAHARAGSTLPGLVRDPLGWLLAARVRDEFDGRMAPVYDLLCDEVGR